MTPRRPATGMAPDWLGVAVELGELDDRLHHLTVHRMTGEDEVRRGRHLARQILRGHRDGLGTCESCRAASAETRVTFPDRVTFAVCSGCAAVALAEGAGGEMS